MTYLVLTLLSVVWLSQWSEEHEECLGSGGPFGTYRVDALTVQYGLWPTYRRFGMITSAAGPAIVWRDTCLAFTMAFTSL